MCTCRNNSSNHRYFSDLTQLKLDCLLYCMSKRVIYRHIKATSKSAIAICILGVFIGIATIGGQNQVLAEDKSTSITCTGVGSCEKTECVNGVCETTPTNSSNISTSQGSSLSGDKESDTGKSAADSLRERLSLRGDK